MNNRTPWQKEFHIVWNMAVIIRHSIFLFFISVTCLTCSRSGPYPPSQRLDLVITEKLAFGLSDTLSDASLLAAIGVRVDEEGRMYVADAAAFAIKVFSPDGTFLYRFGRRGRGPGEFINIRGFSLIDSSIFIWDQALQRLSIFNIEGEFRAVYPLKGVAAPIDIYSLGNTFLVVYADFNASISKKKLAHIYNENFSRRISDFLPIGEVNDKFDGKAGAFLLGRPGSFYKVTNQKLLFIPYIYNGNIYEYTKVHPGQWKQSARHKARVQREPVTILHGGEARRPDVSISSRFFSEPFRFLLHNQSRGLFKAGKYLVHFTFCDVADERVFGVEVYDKTLHYIGYAPIKPIPITHESDNFLEWFVGDTDGKGTFYVREFHGSGSQIRVLHIDFSGLKES